jgi:Tol biopolymer transport system component
MTWFTRSGVEEETIANIGDYSDFRIAPVGRRILASLNGRDGAWPHIWLYDQHRELISKQTMDAFIVASPVWSPKGDYYVYRTNRGGIMDLRKRDLASGQDTDVLTPAQRQAHQDAGNFIPADISTDGKSLIYSIAGTEGYDVYTIPLEGGGPPRKLAAGPHSEMHPSISPDGKWVAYSSDESGRFQVYVQSFETGDRKEQVSAEGGAEPRWSGDGRELYYLSDSQMLMAVPFRDGVPGKPTALFQAKTPSDVNPYRQRYVPSADGRRFLIYTVDTSQRQKPITVTLNWLASIKR